MTLQKLKAFIAKDAPAGKVPAFKATPGWVLKLADLELSLLEHIVKIHMPNDLKYCQLEPVVFKPLPEFLAAIVWVPEKEPERTVYAYISSSSSSDDEDDKDWCIC